MNILEYKEKYIDNNSCPPGEHHFVAVYLLNKFKGFVPDYINPDGEKNIPGDIVFYNDKKNKSISFEVKVSKKNKKSFTFTAKQFNEWFVSEKKIPDYLIALTQNCLFFIDFPSFIKEYKKGKGKEIKQIFDKKKKNSSTFNEACLKRYCSNEEVIELVGENVSKKDINQKIDAVFAKFHGEIENVYK